MTQFLGEKVPSTTLELVKSLPCTHHNLVAVFNSWKIAKKDFSDKTVGLVTNFYHLPRALKLAALLKRLEFKESPDLVPINAESIFEIPESNNTRQRLPEYLRRLESERQGIRELENDSYKDNCLNKKEKFEILEEIINKKKEILLTRQEREKFGKGYYQKLQQRKPIG